MAANCTRRLVYRPRHSRNFAAAGTRARAGDGPRRARTALFRLIVLSSPYSSAALVASMLGRHPSAYAVPELNLFAEPCLSDLLDRLPANRMHGLLRAVAQIYGGEQTLESVEMARRWIFRRARQETPIVYRELCQRITPRRLIEASTLYAEGDHEKILRRIRDAFPEADYLHLVRHPFAQCLSWLQDPSALPELQRHAGGDKQ